MATSNKSKKILEKARKVAAKTKKKKESKVDVKKKTTSHPEGQNPPQSKRYTQEADKTLSAKATGWRWTKEGAKKLGKNADSKPTTSDVEKYRNETFKLKGKPNKSGPKGVGDGSYRYLYVERRADKSDIIRKNKLEDGGEMAKGGENEDLRKRFEGYTDEELQIFNGDNKETLKYWNRKDAIEDAIKSTLDEQDSQGYIGRGGKIPSNEVKDFTTYVTKFYGEGNLDADIFPPFGASKKEIDYAIKIYVDYCDWKKEKTGDSEWGDGDTMDREVVRDIMLYNRGFKEGELMYARTVKAAIKHHNKDKKEYGGILQPMIGGVNADPRFDIFNTAMFAEKGAELAKGGITPIYEVGVRRKGKPGMFVVSIRAKDEEAALKEFHRQNSLLPGAENYKVVGVYKTSRKRLEDGGEMAKGGKISDKFKKEYDYGDREGYIRDFGSVELEVKGKDKEIKLVALAKIMNIYDATGDEQFEKTPYEVTFEIVPTLKHIDKKHIESAMDSSGVDELSSINYGDIFEHYMSGVSLAVDGETFKLFATYDEAKDYIYSKEVNDDITVSSRLVGFALDRPVNRIGTTGWSYLTAIVDKNHDPYKFAKGGKTHEQGYDDREDERIAMRHGKISQKDFVGSHAKREHSRRDDARFETRHKSAYGGVTDVNIQF